MKKFIILSILFLISSFIFAQDVYVSGYYRANGTYVKPHYRTAPNHTINDNYSTYPNVNPYTRKVGTIAPDYTTLIPNLTPSLSTDLTYDLNSNLTYNLNDNLGESSLSNFYLNDNTFTNTLKNVESDLFSEYKIDFDAYLKKKEKEHEEFIKLLQNTPSTDIWSTPSSTRSSSSTSIWGTPSSSTKSSSGSSYWNTPSYSTPRRRN